MEYRRIENDEQETSPRFVFSDNPLRKNEAFYLRTPEEVADDGVVNVGGGCA